ncbi:MAG: tetratricopeptide repeat protein, partial [Luteibaculum sp.]
DAVWYELARIQAMQGNANESIRSIEKAVNINDQNGFYLELAAELHRSVENVKEALEYYDRIIKLKPQDPGAYLGKAEIYEELGDIKKTEALYEKVIELSGETLEISYRKIQGFVRANRLDKAIEETSKLIKDYPLVSELKEMQSDFYLMKSEPEKAISLLEQILETEPQFAKAHLKLAFIFINKGNFSEAIRHAEEAFTKPDLSIDDKMRLMLVFYESSNLDKTHVPKYLDLAKQMTIAHPGDGKAFAIYGDILLRENKFEEALNSYRKAVKIAADKKIIWERILEIETNLGQLDSLLIDAKQCVKLFPSQPIFYLYLGLAEMQKQNYEDAVFSLESGLALVVNQPALRIQFLSLLGDAYTAMEKFNKADKLYEQVLQLDPNNGLVLNNYSYSLAERNTDLKRAKEMAEKAVQFDGQSSSFLDTYAWILFRMGDYDKARLYIQRAIDAGGSESGTILEHYGDILFKQGNTEDALEYWKRAAGKEGGSEKLSEKIEKQNWVD